MKYAQTMRVGGLTVIVPKRPPKAAPKGERRKRHAMWRKGVRACYRCGGKLRDADSCTLEHIVPLCEGGANTLASGNLSLSHYKCNNGHGGIVSERIRVARWKALPWWKKMLLWWGQSQHGIAKSVRRTYYVNRYRFLRHVLGWSDNRINGART